MTENWILYILKCKDDTLYTGITNDLDRRIGAHVAGKGAKYTKGRAPLKLIYQEEWSSKGDALKREIQIKKLRKDDKLKLIADQK
jgi:putative endonuclease